MVLNLKGIPYKTEWIEYPDIAPTLKSFGVPPTEEEPPYTLPTIRIGSDKYVMDSHKIAIEVEQLHPLPPLYLDSPMLPKVQELLKQGVSPLRGVLMPNIPRNLLNPRSAEYFEETRSVRFGMPLSQLEKEQGGESAWTAAEPAMKELGALLRAEGGPFVLGKTGESLSSSRALDGILWRTDLEDEG